MPKLLPKFKTPASGDTVEVIEHLPQWGLYEGMTGVVIGVKGLFASVDFGTSHSTSCHIDQIRVVDGKAPTTEVNEFGLPKRKISGAQKRKERKAKDEQIFVQLIQWLRTQVTYKDEGIILRFGEQQSRAFVKGMAHPLFSFLVHYDDCKELAKGLRKLADALEKER